MACCTKRRRSVIHTLVQCLTDNVPLRGRVFLINFAGLVMLAGHVVLLAFGGAGALDQRPIRRGGRHA